MGLIGAGSPALHVILTWNRTHLANGHVIRRLVEVNAKAGRFTPVVVTPDVLLGTETGDVP